MTRPFAVAAGIFIGAVSLILLGLSAISANHPVAVETDQSWLEPWMGATAALAGGIGLAIAALAIGIGMGRWRHPKPVPTPEARHHEGVQG
jgi:hypothetical protein